MSTPGTLLAELRLSGAAVWAEGTRLLCRGAKDAPDLKRQGSGQRKELLALLTAEKGLPAGTRLFFEADSARICWPEEAVLWTWQGAPGWVYTADRAPPSCEPALSPPARKRCKQCGRRQLRVSWQTCCNGERRLRV